MIAVDHKRSLTECLKERQTLDFLHCSRSTAYYLEMWELDSLEIIHIHALQPTTINHASSSKLSIQDKKICCLKDIRIT